MLADVISNQYFEQQCKKYTHTVATDRLFNRTNVTS